MKEMLRTFIKYLKKIPKSVFEPPKVLILLRASLIFQEIHMFGKSLFFKDALTKINTFDGFDTLFQRRFLNIW